MRPVELTHEAEVDDGDAVVIEDENIAGVKVGMHEAVFEDHLHQRAQAEARDALGIARALVSVENLAALDMGHTQDARGRIFLENLGKDDVGLIAEILSEAVVVARFDAKVELGVHGAAKLLDGGFGRHRRKRRNLAEQVRHLAHDRKVEGADFQHLGPAHFDGHDPSVM